MDYTSKERMYFASIRWEFLRRDPTYIEAWGKVRKLREGQWLFGGTLKEPLPGYEGGWKITDCYLQTPEGKKEMELAEPFFGKGSYLVDPELSFDEANEDEKMFRSLVISAFKYPISVSYHHKENESLEDFFLTLRVEIDLQQTNNLTEVRKAFNQEIKARWLIKDILAKCSTADEAFARIAEKYSSCAHRNPLGQLLKFTGLPNILNSFIGNIQDGNIQFQRNKKKIRNKIDFEKILKVGDVAKEKLIQFPEYEKQGRITEGLFVKIYNENPEFDNINPKSAIQGLKECFEKYQYLTSGGWREITYP